MQCEYIWGYIKWLILEGEYYQLLAVSRLVTHRWQSRPSMGSDDWPLKADG